MAFARIKLDIYKETCDWQSTFSMNGICSCAKRKPALGHLGTSHRCLWKSWLLLSLWWKKKAIEGVSFVLMEEQNCVWGEIALFFAFVVRSWKAVWGRKICIYDLFPSAVWNEGYGKEMTQDVKPLPGWNGSTERRQSALWALGSVCSPPADPSPRGACPCQSNRLGLIPTIDSVHGVLILEGRKQKPGIFWNFPGGPVAKTLCSQCRGPRFQPLVREVDPSCPN